MVYVQVGGRQLCFIVLSTGLKKLPDTFSACPSNTRFSRLVDVASVIEFRSSGQFTSRIVHREVG